jgi:hypothetical protein
MKIWITFLLSLFLGTVQAQKVDSTHYNVPDYYDYQYTKDLYQYEKNKMIWNVVGSATMVVGNTVSYYRYGQSGYAYFGGLSLGFNIYSVVRLVSLNRKIKKMEYE